MFICQNNLSDLQIDSLAIYSKNIKTIKVKSLYKET
jgi:hypothetical protein